MEGTNKTIYIADGEESQELASYFEKSNNYKLVGFSNEGEKVIKEVSSLKPDYLVMEVLLTGKDGFKVLDELKGVMGEELPKVIFLSSISHSGFVSKAIKEGASYFMVKPVSPALLDERIQDIESENAQASAKNDKQLDEKISNIFISIGIPAH